METKPLIEKGPRELRCPECGHWMRRRPGDRYGCPCGNFTYLTDTEDDAIALANKLREADPGREVVIDYE
jgi:hypothetical protein